MRGRVLPEKSSFQLYFPAPLLGVSSYYRESGAHLSRQSAREESRVPSLLDRHFKCETRSEKTYPLNQMMNSLKLQIKPLETKVTRKLKQPRKKKSMPAGRPRNVTI